MTQSDDDGDNLRQLVDADLDSPPPAGAPITIERLLARRRRLARRRAFVAAAALALLAPLAWWSSTLAATVARPGEDPRAAATAARPIADELATLTARLDQLLCPPPAPRPFDRSGRRDAGRRLRLELALARAAALPDRPSTTPSDRPR